VSFGNGCAQANFPGVYARVSSYGTFVQQTIGTAASAPAPAPVPVASPVAPPTPKKAGGGAAPPTLAGSNDANAGTGATATAGGASVPIIVGAAAGVLVLAGLVKYNNRPRLDPSPGGSGVVPTPIASWAPPGKSTNLAASQYGGYGQPYGAPQQPYGAPQQRW
jgi:hypothetical protein